MACLALIASAQLACTPPGEPVAPADEHSQVTLTRAESGAPGERTSNEGAAPSAPAAPRELSGRELMELDAQLHATLSPCTDQPISLKQCIDQGRPCVACAPAGAFLTRMVRQGLSRSERERLFSMRFDADQVTTIEIGRSPARGPADAPVTLVEWVDFQCPACAAMSSFLALAMERFPGQVRWVQKTYVLPIHGFEPALAGAAAASLGKYWEMHDRMFANQSALSHDDLLRHAAQVGLDRTSFEKLMKSPAARQRVEDDMKAADALGIDGTPPIYINGRKLALESLTPFTDELFTWMADEIRMRGQQPLPPSARYQALARELGVE